MGPLPADFDPAALARSLDGRLLGHEVEVLAETDSTNERALEASDAGAPEGRVYIADRQTRGRGRRGRPWFSPPGKALYLSVLLRPPPAVLDGIALTLVGALAVVEALEDVLPLPYEIKWPNDVLVHGGKLAGILAETRGSRERGVAVVLGIGLNVNQARSDFPEDLRRRATSLLVETGRAHDRGAMATVILARLDDLYAAMVRGDAPSVGERIRRRAAYIGRPCRVRRGEDAPFEARIRDLDPRGALIVERAGCEERVYAGDVEIL